MVAALPADAPELVHLSAGAVGVLLDVRGPQLPAVVHWGAALGELPAGQLAELALATAAPPIEVTAVDPQGVSPR